MTKISIDLTWKLNNGNFSPGNYSNKHEIKFNDKIIINVGMGSATVVNVFHSFITDLLS